MTLAETTRDIHQRVTEELVQAGLDEVHVRFALLCCWVGSVVSD
jgi:hypothetical protein